MPVVAQGARGDRRDVRSSIGAVSTAAYGQRTTSPARICRDHHATAFAANIPGRMIVDATPDAAMRSSMSACMAAIGLDC